MTQKRLKVYTLPLGMQQPVNNANIKETTYLFNYHQIPSPII
jgi:hypothetical protein